MENKIQIFEGVKIRYAWDAESEEWMFSAADVCNVLSESASKDPTAYWRKLKQRLLKEGSEVVTSRVEDESVQWETLPDRLFHYCRYATAYPEYPITQS